MFTWGMSFIANNFGVESVAILWRKVGFVYLLESLSRFLRYRTIVEWYESYIETVGAGNSEDDKEDDDDEEYDDQDDFGTGDAGDGG